MKRNRFSILLVCVALLFTMVTTAFADAGPKPSVRVNFTGGSGERCYGTLLSQEWTTGPHSAYQSGVSSKSMWQDNHSVEEDPDAEEIWNAFEHYEDPDGFYFLQQWWTCADGEQLAWTYYPPETFKLGDRGVPRQPRL